MNAKIITVLEVVENFIFNITIASADPLIP
jgi:hypothetical protein